MSPRQVLYAFICHWRTAALWSAEDGQPMFTDVCTRDYLIFRFTRVLHISTCQWIKLERMLNGFESFRIKEFTSISVCQMSHTDVNQDRFSFSPYMHSICMHSACVLHSDCFAGDFAVWGPELAGLPQPGCRESPWSSNKEIKVCLQSGEATNRWPDCK